MTQEDKQLLLVDLCARLPYRVKCQITDTNDESFVRSGKLLEIKDMRADFKGTTFLFFNEHVPCYSDITEIKPYLRPLSSMTDEEKKEYVSFIGGQKPFDCDFSAYPTEYRFVYEWDMVNYVNWLNTHHFDYRGLIEKGLAIEAPNDIY